MTTDSVTPPIHQLQTLYFSKRITLRGPDAYHLHGHDFAEIFWVEDGTFTQQVNQHSIEHSPGDLILLRPQDFHSFHTAKNASFRIINTCFHWQQYLNIKNTYFPDQDIYHENAPLPKIVHLTHQHLQFLESLFQMLASAPLSVFEIERFLMNILSVIQSAERHHASSAPSMPSWLRIAHTKIQEPALFCQGPTAFHQLCNRSPEHVSREFKKYTGETIAHFITRLRMEFAAKLLTTTDEEIIDISLQCGYESLSHFYASFKSWYKSTPRSYRCHFEQNNPIQTK